jgi:uncharacterized protein
MIYELTPEGLKISLKVIPKASSAKLLASSTDAEGIRVYVTSVPEDGKANKAVIELLAKALRVAKSRITILQGLTSRHKTVLIEGDPGEILIKLKGILDEH